MQIQLYSKGFSFDTNEQLVKSFAVLDVWLPAISSLDVTPNVPVQQDAAASSDFVEVNNGQSYLDGFSTNPNEQLVKTFAVLDVSLPAITSLDVMPKTRVQVDVAASLVFVALAPTIVVLRCALPVAIASHTVTPDMARSGLR